MSEPIFSMLQTEKNTKFYKDTKVYSRYKFFIVMKMSIVYHFCDTILLSLCKDWLSNLECIKMRMAQ